MTNSDKAKQYTDIALEKAGEFAEMAGSKAQELTEMARDRAPEVVDKVADLAEKAIEAVDKATGGRFHDYLPTGKPDLPETPGTDVPKAP
jgi:hypothetical protein